ncbi:unnamed protein product [Diabrotica balteata]|uniref:Uncharacterized protein n=1 Tax=Diabrotica balteata TaxID=107213 RepID=A0A9N9SQJ9_DIABA|nr:unnamed protein product [Diabrotica balteata]
MLFSLQSPSQFRTKAKNGYMLCLAVLLYSAEVWMLKVSIMNKIKALEMWVHRRMLKIPWTARKTNEEVLRSVNKDRELIKTVKHRKMSYLGHIVRGSRYKILQLILKGKIECRGGIGRQQVSW